MMIKYEASREVYKNDSCLDNFKSSYLKTFLKLICSEERKDNPSQFKTVQDMKNRLDNCNIPWKNYFLARVKAETSEKRMMMVLFCWKMIMV